MSSRRGERSRKPWLWPVQNKGEAAVLYCFAFLFIAALGTGRFGLAHRRRS